MTAPVRLPLGASAGAGGRPPRVSVVMAVHDGEPFVAEAIASLLAQSLADLELLVVNDGSTDRTADIVRSFDDPRVRMIDNDRNLGLAASLNRGIGLARGELVARQDADDRSAPERLARQVAFLDAHPDVALVGSWYTEINPDGTPRRRRPLPTTHADILWHLCLYCPFVHSAVMWRRAMVAELVGEYDERLSYSMDYDLWRRIAGRCRVANLAEYLVDLRIHETSMTATYGDRALEGSRLQAEHAARLLGWPADDWRGNVSRLERLRAMAMSTPRGRTLAELRADAEGVVELYEAFAREGSVSAADARRHRRWIRGRMGLQFLRAARAAADRGRREESWQLLRAAAGWAPRGLVSRDGARAYRALAYRALATAMGGGGG